MRKTVRTRAVNLRNEPYDVYIGRPSKYGNPYRLGFDGDRKEVIRKYAQMLQKNPGLQWAARQVLQGKRLGCFCKPEPCHGDILARVADGMTPAEAFRALYGEDL